MSVKPIRIQRKRVKGYNMQEASKAINGLEAISVCRPGKHGNPFKVGDPAPTHGEPMTAEDAVFFYKESLDPRLYPDAQQKRDEIKRELKNKNPACFCGLDQPCHGDVLLEIAND